METSSQKMETDQVPESELPPVPEDGDLNATVIEVMTDVEVLHDGSSVIDVFAANSARRKRVEISERKLTESDRKLFRKAQELELQSWLDHRVFDLVKKKIVDQERVMRARWVLTWKLTGKAKARLCVLGFQDPDLTEVPHDSPTLSAASEALIMQWVASHKYRLISGDIKTAFQCNIAPVTTTWRMRSQGSGRRRDRRKHGEEQGEEQRVKERTTAQRG